MSSILHSFSPDDHADGTRPQGDVADYTVRMIRFADLMAMGLMVLAGWLYSVFLFDSVLPGVLEQKLAPPQVTFYD